MKKEYNILHISQNYIIISLERFGDNMKKLFTIMTLLVSLFVLTACNRNDEIDTNIVYTTTYPVQFLAEELSGDNIQVQRVPGVSAHGDSIDWSARDIIDIKESDLLIYVDGGADSYIDQNMTILSDGDLEFLNLSTFISYNFVCLSHDLGDGHSHDDEHDDAPTDPGCEFNTLSTDPHFWLDPVLMAQAAELIKDKLIVTFPEEQATIENNYTTLSATLTQLHEKFQELDDDEDATKPIITTVMLFTYWHERYDFEIFSITKDAHSSETNITDLDEIVTIAKDNNIMYIMFEKNANSPAGESVIEVLQTTRPSTDKLYLHGLGNLTQEEIDAGETYITIMYDNLDALKLATK